MYCVGPDGARSALGEAGRCEFAVTRPVIAVGLREVNMSLEEDGAHGGEVAIGMKADLFAGQTHSINVLTKRPQ